MRENLHFPLSEENKDENLQKVPQKIVPINLVLSFA